ncbi:SpoIIE family protein phosphatase [Streptomyces tailanensis]|uniref:SpoIIE family protein phosphatase n=1 Tax=Streptomyces tailanensis TaxID=2569858 RepID=UPI001FEA8FE9|nr:SpoIIE family protein phosphatase [Streptomyces tailanensis]
MGGLNRAYERFLTEGSAGAEVRGPILSSWQRSRALGVVPNQLEIPYQEDLDQECRLLDAARPVLDRLESAVRGGQVSVILTDGQGWVLQRRTSSPELDRSLDAVNLAVGFTFAESVAGTNGIGTVLAERRPAFIMGREHFAECMSPFTCVGAPIRNPLSGEVEGVLDLTCLREETNSAMLPLVRKAAGDIEQRLLEGTTSREHQLLSAFLRSRKPTGQPASRSFSRAVGAFTMIDKSLAPGDQALLRRKAAELISSPGRAAAEVALSDGRVASLTCQQMTGPKGQAGAAVEAVLTPARERSRMRPKTAPQPGWAEARLDRATVSGPAMAVTRPGAVETGERRATEAGDGADGGEWLLMLGEPGVGRLAVQARQRLELLCDASVHIGSTLDVVRTAEELAEMAVPQLADTVAVDLLAPVLTGSERAPRHGELRRAALCTVGRGNPLTDAAGDPVRYAPSTPQARCLAGRQSILEPVLSAPMGRQAHEPARAAEILGSGIHSLIVVPMHARGTLLGVVSFYRSEEPAAFEGDDLYLAEELVGRAALCIDNARRYTREHAVALALQRSLLPRRLLTHSAVQVAHRYLPAEAGVGGDWYDVIPLSGARVALVVGDVVGHGVQAAATMGRLRTAVHNFAALDMPADDLLYSLSDLVEGLDADQEAASEGRIGTDDTDSGGQIVGATCLYAVYDPVSCRCTLARAGHPLPALALPDGTVEFPDIPAGPPLGLGGLPFESVDLDIPEGSELVLYSDGLIEDRARDIDEGLALLRQALRRRERTPEQTCDTVLKALLPAHPADDVALLVARMRALDPGQVATWDLEPEPENVCRTRMKVAEQLGRWGLEELSFTTELIASELLTNAIRHARGPIRVRLLRDRNLICEVSDGSSTSPRMRRAATTDEGGRGLFLIAQLAARWGTRYTIDGKVIWAEQTLPPARGRSRSFAV